MYRLKKLIGLSRMLLIFYIAISLFLLLIGNFSVIIDTLSQGHVSHADFYSIWHQQTQYFLSTFDDYGTGRLVVALFWASLGGILYIVSWIALNFIIGLQNRYIFKTEYTHLSLLDHQHWAAIWSRRLLRAGTLLVLLSYSYLFVSLLYPSCLQLSSALLQDWNWLKGAEAVMGTILSLHIYTLLFRVFWLRSPVFK